MKGGFYMDNVLAKIQLWLFKIGSRIPTRNLNILDRLGNKMQDFRSNHTMNK